MALAACLALMRPASAGLTATTLGTVEVAPPGAARVPLAAALTDDAGQRRTLGEALGGRPAVLIFADYTCRTLCGPVVALAAAGLAQSGLTPGRDYRLVVIGLDPKDTADDARAMKRNQVGDDAILAASSFLLADAEAVKGITDAVGYRYAYDAGEDQFAHPAAVFVLAADGRVARALSGLGLDAGGLRLALVEAGRGRIGTLTDHLRLLCYGFDPAAGVYTLTIQRWLAIAAALTVLALAGGIGLLAFRARPAVPADRTPSAPSGPA
jgi:protein SCO1/2